MELILVSPEDVIIKEGDSIESNRYLPFLNNFL